MVVFLNHRAGGGRAVTNWQRVVPCLRQRFGTFTLRPMENDLASTVDRFSALGETDFVAAGGDGTVNRLAAALLEHGDTRLRLGAVGLGSSNDYHKPRGTSMAGVPVRLDFEAARPSDVLRLSFGRRKPGYALITASIGVTAEANDRFNRLTGPARWRKERLPSLTIIETAARTIGRFRPLPLRIDGAPPRPVANLAVLLSPFCAGSLRYDEELRPRAGLATVAECGNMTRHELAAVVCGLLRGRFVGRRMTRTWATSVLNVRARQPFTIEFDGEIVRADDVSIRVLPNALRCCG